jgi:transposase
MASPTLAKVCKGRAPDVVIGVDTHKDVHVAVALAPNGGQLGEHRIPTTRKGYDDLIVWSEEFGSYPVYAIEGTSSYGAGLTRELQDAGFPVVEVNRTVRSVRRRLGKDDAIDAEAAARHTWRVQPLLHPKPGPTRWR